MTNDPTTPLPGERRRPALPQFDPNAPTEAARAFLPDASPSSTGTPVAPPTTPYAYAAVPPPPPAGTPGGLPVDRAETPSGGVRWSAKKTAVTAGLALVLAAAGAIGAAAALPAGSTGDTGRFGPGRGGFQPPGRQGGVAPFGGQQNGPGGQQLPNLGGRGGFDPNQLGQLDPQNLLDQLDQLGQDGLVPFGSPGDDDGDRHGDGDGLGGQNPGTSTTSSGSGTTRTT